MRPHLHAFLLGATSAALFAVADRLLRAPAGLLLAVFLAALAWRGPQPAAGERYCSVYGGRGLRVGLGLGAALVLGLLALPVAGWLERGLAVLALLLTVPAGRAARRVLLHAGVPSTSRLRSSGAMVAGALLVAAVLPLLPEQGSAALGAAAAFALVLVARRETSGEPRFVEPAREPWTAGWLSVVAVLVAGLGAGSVFAASLGQARATEAGAAFRVEAYFAAVFGAALLGSMFATAFIPRVRRVGMLLGACSLLASLAAALGSELLRERFPAGAGADALPFLSLGREFELAVLLAGIPAFGLGMALPAFARFYGEMPWGSKVMGRLAPDDRRPPDGGPLRLAALLVAWLAGAAWAPHDEPFPCLVVLALGGVASILFDPRSGTMRKIVYALVLGGVAFAVVLRVAP